MFHSAKTIAATLPAALFRFAASTLAGPPLICHSFDIGTAKALPWISHDGNLTGSKSYNVNSLVADTVALLDAGPTILVHRETLRRATLYAQKDPVVAKRLLVRLVSRSDAAAGTPAAALASFDAGYLAETFKQYQSISKASGNPAQNLDGYLIKKAIQLRGNDAQMEFAADLITLNGPTSEHPDHAMKALSGAKSDPLLARNLFTHFMGPQSETMADMITHNSNVKVTH